MLPATTELTPLVLVIARFADRVLVNIQVESTVAGGVNTAVRVLPVNTNDGVGDTAAPVRSFKQVMPVMYLVMLVFAPEVSATVTEPDRLC